MIFLMNSFFVFFLFAIPQAIAGWVSVGGGELVSDVQNPWYLRNTTRVSMCIIVDADTFHVPDNDYLSLRRRVLTGIAYWKKEFSKAAIFPGINEVATQEFVISTFIIKSKSPGVSSGPSACPDDADIRLQFGWLDQKQVEPLAKQVGNISRFIATTIRTEYDTVNMRGKGFIYFGADAGPRKMDVKVIDVPWSVGKGYLIDLAIRHEFGHIFGVPHKGLFSLMAADFLQQAFSPASALTYANQLWEVGFFGWQDTAKSVIRNWPVDFLKPIWHELLEIPQHHRFLNILLVNDKVEFLTGNGGSSVSRGTLIFDPEVNSSWDEVVHIYLPEGEVVFKDIILPHGIGKRPWIAGPAAVNVERSGVFYSADGLKSHKMKLGLFPLRYPSQFATRFSAELEGKWHWDLDKFDSP